MKNLLAPFLFVCLSSLSLMGCVDSLNNVDETETESAETATENKRVEEALLAPNHLSVQIETNLVTVSWNSVESATDYKVYYNRAGSETVSENTNGKTHYAFTTNSVETYRVWVTSVAENEIESDISDEVVLISKDKEIAAVCNECSP